MSRLCNTASYPMRDFILSDKGVDLAHPDSERASEGVSLRQGAMLRLGLCECVL